jgi:hypothetical protein
MNPSPLLFSMTFVASISVLTGGVAWSAYEAEAKQAALTGKSKALKARIPKPKQYYAKPARSIPATDSVKLIASPQLATTQQPLSPVVASSAAAQYVASVSSDIANNPYFANQPAAILPLAARPAAGNPMPKPVVAAPVAVAPAAIAPVIAPVAAIPVPAVASAAPVKTAPRAVATMPAAAAPVIATLPSLEPPIYGVPASAPVAASSYKAPVAAYQPWNSASFGYKGPSTNPYLNPYLNYRAPQPQAIAAPVAVQPLNPFGGGNFKLALPSLPSLPSFPSLPQAGNQESAAYKPAQFNTQQAAATSTGAVSSIFSNLKMMIPLTGDANILPTIKKVYPTGEKPLVVLNFKCPTEVVGITPPPMKLLHEAVNFGFDGLNKTNLLSFNLQQVCS